MGLGVGIVSAWARRLIIDDPTVSIIVSLLTGFAAYLGAEAIGASGILATVSAGLYVGRRLSKILSPVGRVQAFSFWETISFTLEGLAFVLIGLELRTIMEDLADFSLATLLWYGVLVSAAVIVLRLVWVFLFAHVPRYLSRRLRASEPCPPWQHLFLLGWAGMRGVDSLAAALAVPLRLADGATPFPQRSLIVFLSFSVILATLVLQGLTLPLLIRWFNVQRDNSEEKEEARARLAAIKEALQRLEDPGVIADVAPEILAQVRAMYAHRLQSAEAELHSAENDGTATPLRSCQRLLHELLDAERRVVLELRDRGVINNDVLRRIERTLDYEELRLAD